MISIVIKALNEEHRIAAAMESALAALAGRDGEVILADSASTDRTVEIACRYPIKIVQLGRVEDRSCGAGSQLGFQHSAGEYICLMDGDMKLRDGFLAAAICFLEENPTVAGVGGIIVEREEENLEFVKRAGSSDPDRRPGPVTCLDCGGVYRRAAIDAIGYFTDRNLHGGEEFDLGARLYAAGWTLARIDLPAIDHFGHGGNAYGLLMRRMTSKIAMGTGEQLRAAIGRPHFWWLLRHHKTLPLWCAVYAWWLSIIAALLVLPGIAPRLLAAGGLVLAPFALMVLRCRSLRMGVYSVVAWNVYALSLLPGLVRRRLPPTGWIESRVVKDATVSAAISRSGAE
jgi:glycosyltransferase involved in cell wall biosynthesis